MSGLLGKKIGMTRIFNEEGNMVPVTVLEAGPCYVTQLKTLKTDGYEAVQIAFGERKAKNTPMPLKGHFKKANVEKTLRMLREFPKGNLEVQPGDVLKVDIFTPGEIVKVTGYSKGRGFAGVVKRHNFGGGRKTHGQSDRLRAPGSIGQSSYPSKVFKGIKMGGRMGNRKVAARGLEVVRIDVENNLLFVKGSVPGARNSYVEIHKG